MNRSVSRSGKWNGILRIAAFCTLAATMLAGIHPADALARNIKVGIIDCYSGPPAVYANDALNGFKLALADINKTGVLGKQIEFTTRDTKFKVDLALNMAKELIMREEVDLIPYITAILSAKPDAVIFATGGRSMTNVLKAIQTTGMAQRVPIWIHTATDHAVLKPLGPEAPVGVMGTMDYHFYYPDTPANRKFVQEFEAAYGNPPGFPAFHGYITAHFIAEAFKKAGAVDREKFIDAMEGLKIQSPVGQVEMRACDHQTVLPMFLGVTRKSPAYDFVISGDIVTLSGNEVMPTCEEIAAERKN